MFGIFARCVHAPCPWIKCAFPVKNKQIKGQLSCGEGCVINPISGRNWKQMSGVIHLGSLRSVAAGLDYKMRDSQHALPAEQGGCDALLVKPALTESLCPVADG